MEKKNKLFRKTVGCLPAFVDKVSRQFSSRSFAQNNEFLPQFENNIPSIKKECQKIKRVMKRVLSASTEDKMIDDSIHILDRSNSEIEEELEQIKQKAILLTKQKSNVIAGTNIQRICMKECLLIAVY